MIFHHIGIAVKSIKNELDTYKTIGASEISEVFSDEKLGVNVLFLNLGGVRLELVEPRREGSPIDNYIKKKVRMYHKCFIVPSLSQIHEQMKVLRAAMVVKPTPAVAFAGKKVCFYLLPNGDLLEFLEDEHEN